MGGGGRMEGIVAGRVEEVKNGNNKQNNNQPFYLAPSRLSLFLFFSRTSHPRRHVECE